MFLLNFYEISTFLLVTINSACSHLFPPSPPSLLLLPRSLHPHLHPLSGASPLQVLFTSSYSLPYPSSLHPFIPSIPSALCLSLVCLPSCFCFLLPPPLSSSLSPCSDVRPPWPSPPFLMLRLAVVLLPSLHLWPLPSLTVCTCLSPPFPRPFQMYSVFLYTIYCRRALSFISMCS